MFLDASKQGSVSYFGLTVALGYATENLLCWMPCFFKNSSISEPANCGPLSEIRTRRIPKRMIMDLINLMRSYWFMVRMIMFDGKRKM